MRRAAAPLAVALALGGGLGARADELPSAPPPPVDVEARCWDLLETYEAARDYVHPTVPLSGGSCAHVSAPPPPPVPVFEKLEAAALAQVAEELLAEGDPETAVSLLEEALVLLGAPPPES